MEENNTDKPTVDVVHISIGEAESCVEPGSDALAVMIQEHRDVMHKVAEVQGNSPKSLVMSVSKYQAIVQHLQHPEVKVEPHFKHWVKTRRFQLLHLPEEEEQQEEEEEGEEEERLVLVIAKDKIDKWGYNASFLRVVHAGHLSDLVYRTHAEEMQHCGYKRVLEKLQNRYFGVTRVFVQEFCKRCPVCRLKPHQAAPVDSLGRAAEARHRQGAGRHGQFQDAAHVDVIDMRHAPDGQHRFIGHFLEEHSRFHVLFPMKRRAAPELSRLLEERVLGYFGPPRVLHAGQGVALASRLAASTFQKWGDGVTLVERRSLNSRWGRAMERSRRAILQRLADIRRTEWEGRPGQYPWASWLPRVMFTLNSECRDSARDSPYFSVYGCSSPVLLLTQGRCQGREQPPDSEEEAGGRESPGGGGGGCSAEATSSQDEGECNAARSTCNTTLHRRERDHNYITTTTAIKKFKTEAPDYDEED